MTHPRKFSSPTCGVQTPLLSTFGYTSLSVFLRLSPLPLYVLKLGAVWIQIILPEFASAFVCFFFFLTFQPVTVHSKISTPMGPVHYSQDPQISLFNNFFIKNGSHDTIHTFKTILLQCF